MSELRWALLIVGVVFFAALTVWELRRPRQARSGEPSGLKATRTPASDLELPEMHAREPLAGRYPPLVELPGEEHTGEKGTGDTGTFPVLSPAPANTSAAATAAGVAGVAGVAEAAVPEASESGLLEPEVVGTAQPPEPEPPAPSLPRQYFTEEDASQQAAPAGPVAPDQDPEFAIAEAASRGLPERPGSPAPLVDWPPDAERRVVALRLVATQPERFAGRSLRQALAAEGFVLGRFDIFHKGDEEQRAVLSAASLNRPGTFDSDTMDSQHFGGLSLFAVLPGPMSPPQAFEELVTTARSLNNRLCGVLQDEGGLPLTPSRIATLRERLTGEAHS